MSKQKVITLLCFTLIIAQLFLFRSFLFPSLFGHIKVKGLACTCPDETVLQGSDYLESHTPDSLKKYDLDFSEIYVSERPSNSLDPMGVDEYWIKGEVNGKQRVYEKAPWNLLLKVESWLPAKPHSQNAIYGLLVIELLILVFLIRPKR